MVGVQFYAIKRVLRGIDLLPEKIEVLLPPQEEQPATGSGTTRAATSTYKLRIISRIAFKFYNYRW